MSKLFCTETTKEIKHFKTQKNILIHIWDKAFEGTNVNVALPSLQKVSHKSMLTVT